MCREVTNKAFSILLANDQVSLEGERIQMTNFISRQSAPGSIHKQGTESIIVL